MRAIKSHFEEIKLRKSKKLFKYLKKLDENWKLLPPQGFATVLRCVAY